MEDEQKLLVVGTDDKRASSEVPGLVLAPRRRILGLEKSKHSLTITRLVMVFGYDSFELVAV